MSNEPTYDLLVIGGGINGAGIAHLAAKAGAKVLLVEKGDWASGTSSRSTKLLHGGIRYLENFEFDLVAESLKERYLQWKAAPHLVKPLRFVIPVFKGQGRPLWEMKLGVKLYDFLSGPYRLGGSGDLSIAEGIHLMPSLRSKGLVGAVTYYDAQMDDARICLENVLMARRYGAEVLNYTEAVEFIFKDGKAVGAKLKVDEGEALREVTARGIIVAAGPWTDTLRRRDDPAFKNALRLTKGVHVLVRGNIGTDALLLQNDKDGRIFFMIPFHGQVLIGTTDTDYGHLADDVQAQPKDIDYLISQAAGYFPDSGIKAENIITAFAGLRPLVMAPRDPSRISRKHVIKKEASGIYYVMGGKYTTYRAIAVDCLAKVMPQLDRGAYDSNSFELFGSYLKPVDVGALALQCGVDPGIINNLMAVYGSRYDDVLALCRQDPQLKEPLCSCSPAIRAQVKYARTVEMARTVDDIHARRLGLVYNDCLTKQCRMGIAQMIGQA